MKLLNKKSWLMVVSMLAITLSSHGEMRTASGPYKNSSNLVSAKLEKMDAGYAYVPTEVLSVTIEIDSYVSSAGAGDGSLTAVVSGGTPPYTYLWSTGATTASIDGLFEASYDLVEVKDAVDATVSSSIVLTVASASPTFTSTPVTTVDDDATYNYTVTTSDPDVDPVVVTAMEKPSWLSFNGILLTGSAVDQTGDHHVMLKADDGLGGITTQEFTITISDVTPPFVSAPFSDYNPNATYDENDTDPVYYIQAQDTNPLTYSLGTELDESFFDIVSNTGVITFKVAPDYENPQDEDGYNDYEISLTISDGINEVTRVISVRVNNFSDENPEFKTEPITSVGENSTYTYQGYASDIDGDELMITATTKPDWLSFSTEDLNYIGLVEGPGFDDGNIESATFSGPTDVALNLNDGNIYVADKNNHSIRIITQSNETTTYTGFEGEPGNVDGTLAEASFDSPHALAIDQESGVLYIAEANRIRMITPEGMVSTFLEVEAPEELIDIAVDAEGSLYFATGGFEIPHTIYRSSLGDEEPPFVYADDIGEIIAMAFATDGQSDLHVVTYGNLGPLFPPPPEEIGLLSELEEPELPPSAYSIHIIEGGEMSPPLVVSESPLSSIAIGFDGNMYCVQNDTEVVQFSLDGGGPGPGPLEPFDVLELEPGMGEECPCGPLEPGQPCPCIEEECPCGPLEPGQPCPCIEGPGNEGIVVLSGLTGGKGLFAFDSDLIFVADSEEHRIMTTEILGAVFELTGDAGEPGSHEVVLESQDEFGGAANQAFTITITDAIAPVFTSAITVEFVENGTNTAYTAFATDANAVMYSLGTENDEALFKIEESTGLVSFMSAPDFENPMDEEASNSYVINIIASDGNNSANQDVTITITNINEAPTFDLIPSPNQTVAKDAEAQTVAAFASNLSNGDGQSDQVLTFSVTNDNNQLFSVQPSIDIVTGDLTYTLEGNNIGKAMVTINLSDDGGIANGGIDASDDQSFEIEVTEKVVAAIGNDSFSLEHVSLYPNPTSGIVNVDLMRYKGSGVKAIITGVTGTQYFSQESNGSDLMSIDVQGYAPGIYLLSLKSTDETISKRLIIK